MAHVHVVIIGLAKRGDAPKERRLFSYDDPKGVPQESRHTVLSPYLFDAGRLANPHIVVKSEHRPINGFRRLKTGVQMIDNGILTFSEEEKEAFLTSEPTASKFFRRYIGGDEFINGFYRWILYLREATATLFAITCFQELQPGVFERNRVLWANIILSLVSVVYSYSIWNRITIVRIAKE